MTHGASRAALAVIALVLAACGAGAPNAMSGTPSRASTAPPERDWALELAGRLPRGADRCAVARPPLLGTEERALYAPIAHTATLAWDAQLGVVAYARAEREPRGQAIAAEVVLLRVEVADAEVRARLGAASGLDLRWDTGPTPCGPDACPTQARFVEAGVVKLERGAWPEAPSGKGVAGACRSLAERHPDAVEVWGRRERALPLPDAAGSPIRSTGLVLRRPDGVRIEREDLMGSMAAAASVVAGAGGAASPTALGPAGATGVWRQVDSAALFELDVYWEDLRFAREDDLRMAAAERYAEALVRLEPDAAIDVGSLDAVVAQIEARLDLLELAHVGDPELLAGTHALVELGLARHPGDARLTALRERLARHEASSAPAR